MNYKVVPLDFSKNVNQELQDIINNHSSSDWEYVNHVYQHYLRPGTNGCFGLGSRPDEIVHVGHIIFKKK